jgi:hypothetical protein
MRRTRPDPDSDVGRLLAEFQRLRKSEGLTRTKVARAEVLCGLAVVQAEAQRLRLAPEEVAYRLVVVASYALKDAHMRGLVINALAIEHTPTGASLTDRRRRYAADLDESRVRDQEDEALEELARWLLVMEHPHAIFGDYAHNFYTVCSPEWKIGVSGMAADVDARHPADELAWDYVEVVTTLDEQGVAISTETRGLARARLDGVTGYTLHHTNDTGTKPVGIHLIRGGKPGKRHPRSAIGTYALNIDFPEPLPLGQLNALHWVLELETLPDAKPTMASGYAGEVLTRDLTLRVAFHADCLPVSPRAFVSDRDTYPQPQGPVQPLRLVPGNQISMSWHGLEPRFIYVVGWDFSELTRRAAE